MIGVACLLCALFLGCSRDDVRVGLVRGGLELTVGETRDIMPYVTFDPPTSDNRTVKLSSDSDCVRVDGTKIIAVSAGSANVIVSNVDSAATLLVRVAQKTATSLFITQSGKLIQTAAADETPQAVSFTANSDGNTDSVVWSFGDQTLTGSAFEFEPQGYGEFTIAAALDGLVSSKTVAVYRRTQVQVRHDGYAEQRGDFSPVVFTATEAIDALNPRSRFVWFVNGAESGRGQIFEFTPKRAGEYKISLEVNGENKQIDGAQAFTVTAIGDRSPIGRLVFDDADGVYVAWNDGERPAFVSIIAPNGNRKNFDGGDATCAYLFSTGKFRATDFIEVCANAEQAPSAYKIVLGAEGRTEFTFAQYESQAAPYISQKVLLRNSFISDAHDGALWLRELYVTGRKKATAYLARGATGIEQAIASQAEMLGLSASVTVDGSILTAEISDYRNAPLQYESHIAHTAYRVAPHLEYSSENLRAADYAFAIDRIARTAVATTTEQLLLIAESGARPITEKDSSAEVVLAAAKRILRNIMGKDYSDEQKVHAVYDWLQVVAVKSKSDGGDLCGNYLEGLFGSANIDRPEGQSRAPLSEFGFAKCFTLLCRIEGLECVTAYSNGRYWNKVRLDGMWYNIDVFGAKIILPNKAELMSHAGLLIDDDAATVFGLQSDGQLRACDGSRIYYYTKSNSGVDNYIDVREATAAAVRAAVFACFDGEKRGAITIVLVGSRESSYYNNYGCELLLDVELSQAERAMIAEYAFAAVRQYAEQREGVSFGTGESSVRVEISGNIMTVTAVPTVEANDNI